MRRVHPDYPPRARLERAIASARVVLAVGASVAVWISPITPVVDPVLIAYLLHSLVVLALVWSPVRFARSWSIVIVHVTDLLVVSLLLFLQGPESPFFIYFVFSVVCGALRWQLPGALWTTAAALGVYTGITIASGVAVFDDRFVVRDVQLAVVAAMVGYLTAYYARIQREVLGMAA